MRAVGQAAPATIALDQSTASTTETGIRPLRVLVAEDGLVNQKLAVGLLERRGHQALVANNGNEAVEAFLTESIDLVLMDVQMPEVDGLEATRAIRAHEAKTGGHVPIVAMTAHAMQGDRERCLAAGMDDYVAKPIRGQQLFATIASVLGIRDQTEIEPDEPQSTEEGVIDWPQTLEGMDGQQKLLLDLVSIVLRECPRLLGEIRAAIDTSDAAALKFYERILNAREGLAVVAVNGRICQGCFVTITSR